MMKLNLSYIIMLNYPILINFFILIIMLLPYKTNKIHPMLMIILLVLLTTLISLKMNIMYKSWMNFILFLIMIGGLMIIFLYITSLINNENLYMNFKSILMNFLKYLMLLLLLILMFKLMFNVSFINSQDIHNFNFNLFEKKNELNLSELYYYNMNPMMFIMLYLYYSMICIMNICYKLKKPLRQLNMYE